MIRTSRTCERLTRETIAIIYHLNSFLLPSPSKRLSNSNQATVSTSEKSEWLFASFANPRREAGADRQQALGGAVASYRHCSDCILAFAFCADSAKSSGVFHGFQRSETEKTLAPWQISIYRPSSQEIPGDSPTRYTTKSNPFCASYSVIAKLSTFLPSSSEPVDRLPGATTTDLRLVRPENNGVISSLTKPPRCQSFMEAPSFARTATYPTVSGEPTLPAGVKQNEMAT